MNGLQMYIKLKSAQVADRASRRILVLATFSVMCFGSLVSGCGEGARAGKVVTPVGPVRQSAVVAEKCTSGCLSENAVSGGERRIAQRKKAELEKIGQPASKAQRVAIMLGVNQYVAAVRRSQYTLACEKLSAKAVSELAAYRQVQKRDHEACPEVLEQTFGSAIGSHAVPVGLKITDISAIRVDRGHGYVLLRVSGHTEEQVMSVAYEHGRWLAAAPQPYSLAYASPAS